MSRVSDTFTGADSADIGANWTTITSLTALQRVSNRVRTTDLEFEGERYSGASFGAAQYSQVTLTTFGGASKAVATAVRCASGAQTFYQGVAADFSGQRTYIERFVATVTTILINSGDTTTWAAGNVLRTSIDANGVIRMYKDGLLVLSYDDTNTIASGDIGLLIFNGTAALANVEVDDFEGGDLADGGVMVAGVVESLRTGTTDPMTWSHNVGTTAPKGVLVAFIHGVSATDHVVSVTYGGVSMTRVQRNTDAATELGAAEWWFLGASVPTGTQTVSADLASATTDDILGVSITLDGGADLAVIDVDGIDNNVANPSRTMNYGGKYAMSFGALYSGLTDLTAITAGTGCVRISTSDLAGAWTGCVIRQITPGTADFAIGVTSATDDVAYACVTVAKAATITSTVGTVTASAAVVTTSAKAIWRTTGTVAAAATVTATSKTIWRTAGAITAAASVTATSKAIWKAAGTITAAASVTSHGAAIQKSAGTITAAATVSGDAQAIRKTAGAITAAAAVTATAKTVKVATGAVISTSTVAAIAKAIRKTVGTVAATATVSGNGVDANSGFEEATGTVAASATVTAAAKAIWKTSGAVVSVSSVQAVSKVVQSTVGTSQAQAAVLAVGEAVSLGNIQSAVGTVQAQATVSAEGEDIGEEPEVPPTIPPEPPVFAGWQDTYLHNISAFGGMDPMGSGSYGATYWRPTTPVDNSWKDTSLHNIAAYGAFDPMGAGSYGDTDWRPTTPVDSNWKNTSLHDVAAYGAFDPMGSGSYGGTVWTVTN